MTTDLDAFKKALGADVVIPLAEPGTLSITEALALRRWYDERMEVIRLDQEHAR